MAIPFAVRDNRHKGFIVTGHKRGTIKPVYPEEPSADGRHIGKHQIMREYMPLLTN